MKYFLSQLVALAVAGALLPAAARAQAADTVRGLRGQPAPALSAGGMHFTIDERRHKGPLAVIYVDGQRRDSTKLADLNPNDIATVSILKADAARQLGPDEARLGVVVITTKAGQHRHSTRAFDKRLRKLRPPGPPAAPPTYGPN
ncbi:hypothetical protein GCM10027422_07400 [Hymenobacter arcticus]